MAPVQAKKYSNRRTFFPLLISRYPPGTSGQVFHFNLIGVSQAFCISLQIHPRISVFRVTVPAFYGRE
jgi:hypothetical protein